MSSMSKACVTNYVNWTTHWIVCDSVGLRENKAKHVIFHFGKLEHQDRCVNNGNVDVDTMIVAKAQ